MVALWHARTMRAVEHRVGAHHARPLAEVTLEQVDRALELGQVGVGRAFERLERNRALEHAAGAQRVDHRALLHGDRGRQRQRGHEVARHDDAARPCRAAR